MFETDGFDRDAATEDAAQATRERAGKWGIWCAARVVCPIHAEFHRWWLTVPGGADYETTDRAEAESLARLLRHHAAQAGRPVEYSVKSREL